MAGDEEETRGLGRRPPIPDRGEWTRAVQAGLEAEGVPEPEARAEARRKCERFRLRHAWFRERFEAFLDMRDRAGEACLQYGDARGVTGVEEVVVRHPELVSGSRPPPASGSPDWMLKRVQHDRAPSGPRRARDGGGPGSSP